MLRQAGHPWAEETHQHGAGCGHEQDGQPTVQRSAAHEVLHSAGQPLDSGTRADMEARFGADFTDVRVHNDGAARASAAEIGARAYTSGNHIVLGDGGGDRHTLAHELTHVIQQRQGPVSGTDNGGGLRVSDPSDRFEREAETHATRVLSASAPARKAAEATAPAPGSGDPYVQRMRSDNPHAAGDTHNGWELTAHHIVAHSQLTGALESMDPGQRAPLLRQAVPEVITDKMLENLKVEIPPHMNRDDFKKRFRAALVKTGGGDTAEFQGNNLNEIRYAFYEWQGGNQFLGPSTSLRAEPTKSGDDTDYDGRYFSPLENDRFTNLTTLGDELKAANAAKDKKKQARLLREILSITVNASPHPFDAGAWTEVTSMEEVDRLAGALGRDHMRDYTYFMIRMDEIEKGRYQGISQNKEKTKFFYYGEPIHPMEIKGSFIYIKLNTAQETVIPKEKVSLAGLLPNARETGEDMEFDLPAYSRVGNGALTLDGYAGSIPVEEAPTGRYRMKQHIYKNRKLETDAAGLKLSDFCVEVGVPTSTFLPRVLAEALA
ncbi:DUF4157 domain-containing protein (plasmid) [Streptomyces sp. NBC_01591]|uniref:eCIS core domain-containing protein n=1 Tax=Streptomyces sp. NBC_01591 TaxID=2975888 RepID=UPI002DDB57E7|nr:DUF4157 domain-containing protein [Streptomyces sp. NBC_01591]WSD74645.1 DUF4157 domain-containing protein [Streptomyces sp. NBC_01591]